MELLFQGFLLLAVQGLRVSRFRVQSLGGFGGSEFFARHGCLGDWGFAKDFSSCWLVGNEGIRYPI